MPTHNYGKLPDYTSFSNKSLWGVALRKRFPYKSICKVYIGFDPATDAPPIVYRYKQYIEFHKIVGPFTMKEFNQRIHNCFHWMREQRNA